MTLRFVKFMILIFVFAVPISLALITSACVATTYGIEKSSVPRDLNPDISNENLSAHNANNNQFAFDIYAQLKSSSGNLFFSPFSISQALAMTYAGAKGETETQMADTLHFTMGQGTTHKGFNKVNLMLEKQMSQVENSDADKFQLEIANSIWAQTGDSWRPEFLDQMMTNYGAGIYPEDFASDFENARLRINSWVEEKTKNKIRDLLAKGTLNSATAMVLVNAIYFYGSWIEPFKKEATSDQEFIMADNTKITVPMMFQSEDHRYAEVDDVQVVELPYKNCDISMLVLLPKTDGMEAMETALNNEFIARINENLTNRTVMLSLPKVKMEDDFDLGDTLSTMGMPAAFDPGTADFSGMNGEGGLYISKVIHKAMVDIDEKGTEAAAATAVVMTKSMAPMPSEPVEFTADHPFIIMIRDNETGSILFMGRVNDPRGNQN
jgi:serpin B